MERTMKTANLLFIMSDEHNRRVMGCAGHPMVRTPSFDALAGRGVRFTDAYCNSPICVPSRASFATGRYFHEIGFWDNGIPYDGSVPSWGHRLNEAGLTAVSIGKLHFRSADDRNGFTEEVMPLHVVGGIGDLVGMIRDDTPPRKAALRLGPEAGPGDSSYQRYDERITDAAVEWLRQRAATAHSKPWVLFVSLVCPHFPLLSRPEWYELYPLDQVPWPMFYAMNERPRHPFIDAMRRIAPYDDAFDEASVRRALVAYFGMVSFLDHNVGRLMHALEESGLMETTRVIYTSDHGDNLGARGLWGKSNMYEDSVGIPMLMAGPDIPAGYVCREPVSLVDGFPTILDSAGVPRMASDAGLPGASLFDVIRGHTGPRTVFSEYHASGPVTGAFMVRRGRYKLIHYAGMPPQLFDLAADPWEANDLAGDPGFSGVLAACEADLRAIADPEAIDARARRDQRARIDAFGGREAVLARGTFGHSPVPRETPVYTA
jgi:choline-sulfatase